MGPEDRRPVILASSSPRRRKLLGRLGVIFKVIVPDVDETALPGENPAGHVRRLAADKALAVGGGVLEAVLFLGRQKGLL